MLLACTTNATAAARHRNPIQMLALAEKSAQPPAYGPLLSEHAFFDRHEPNRHACMQLVLGSEAVKAKPHLLQKLPIMLHQ